MARRGALDRDDASISRVDRMECGPPINQEHVLIKRRYNGHPDETARIASGLPDRDPTNGIQAFLQRLSMGASEPFVEDWTIGT